MAERSKRKRRSYPKTFKRRVVAETLEPGASVAAVARRHGLNANMVFLRRGDPQFGPGRGVTAFLPVEVKPGEVPATSEPVSVSSVGQVEITLATGHRLRLSGAFDVDVVLHLARGLIWWDGQDAPEHLRRTVTAPLHEARPVLNWTGCPLITDFSSIEAMDCHCSPQAGLL